jgi:hypothetical protein
MLEVLVHGSPRVRSNVSTYLLPMLFQLDNGILGHLLEQTLSSLKGNLTGASDGNVRIVPPAKCPYNKSVDGCCVYSPINSSSPSSYF